MESNVMKITVRLTVSFLLTVQIILYGCSDTFHEKDLIGVYVLDTGRSINILELKSDGIYVFIYKSRGYPKASSTGKWELLGQEYNWQILLEHSVLKEMAPKILGIIFKLQLDFLVQSDWFVTLI